VGLEGAKNLSQGANKTGGYETDNRTLRHFRFSQRCCLGFKFLQFRRAGDRIPVGARFSAPVQTGPGAYPASYTMGTRSFPGVKWPGRGVDHTPTSSAEVKEWVRLHSYSSPSPRASSTPHPHPRAFVACCRANSTMLRKIAGTSSVSGSQSWSLKLSAAL
jgi:hypothetical protein